MGYAEAAPCEGELIAKVTFAYDEQVFVSGAEGSLEDGEIAFGQGLTLLAVSVAALALGLLPAVVGLAIVLGWTVPLEFTAGAALGVVACLKVGAVAWGILAASRAPRAATPASGLHL